MLLCYPQSSPQLTANSKSEPANRSQLPIRSRVGDKLLIAFNSGMNKDFFVVYRKIPTMVRLVVLLLALLDVGCSFLQHGVRIGRTSLQLDRSWSPTTTIVSMSAPSSSQTQSVSSWSELQDEIGQTPVGAALNKETELRSQGKGSAHVQNKLRTFRSTETPTITLFRDHAGWYVFLAGLLAASTCLYLFFQVSIAYLLQVPLLVSTLEWTRKIDRPDCHYCSPFDCLCIL
jgi:hypothetical protein